MTEYKIFKSYAEQIEDSNKFRGLPLYRFFREQWEAECLLNGKVWISTLQKCREFECPQQGDPYEGSITYQQGLLIIENRVVTEDDYLTALHAGIGIPSPGTFMSGKNIIAGNSRSSTIPNSYLLCTTNNPNDLQDQSSEWKYGVEINLKQSKLFEFLTNALIRSGIPIVSKHHAWANYDSGRIYYDYRQKPQNIAFLKPDLHRKQAEYRFFWLSLPNHNYPKHGILIDCPEIIPFLKKI